MENYLVVLLMSVFVVLGAFYVHTVEQRIQIKQELLQHGYEIKKVKEELEATTKSLTQVKVELEATRNALKQAQVALDSTREQIDMIEKDSARREDIDQIKADVNASRGELNEIKKGYTEKPAFLAFVKHHLSIPNKQIIKFDDVETNIGNHYNPLSGVFTTPTDGLYGIGCLIMAESANDVHYKWMKNNTLILNGLVAITQHANSQTQSFVISLKRGDLISITKTGGGNIHGDRYTYMSGYLLN